MGKLRSYNLQGLNLQVNPMLLQESDLLRAVNVDSSPYGAKTKRAGYGTYLGAVPNGSTVVDMTNFQKANGTQFWNYAFAGGVLYYSTQGTGAWTVCGNGTFSSSGTLTTATLDDTLILADGVGSTRHGNDGTNFVNTTAAPIAVSLAEYHTRIYAAGTAQTLYWSTVGTPTDWTTDSSSIQIPGGGKLLSLFKSADRLVISKNSGRMLRWDELNLVDLATDLGPTSSRSIGNVEDYRIYLNQQGYHGYNGELPRLISNPITPLVRNDAGVGIAGTTFNAAPATAFGNKYFASVGSIRDSLTSEPINNAVNIYDQQYNEFTNYSLAHQPSAWLPFIDVNSVSQLVFASGSQCYKFFGTLTSDNGQTIPTALQGVTAYGSPESDKEWKYFWVMFNPGAQARVQVALTNTFTKEKLTWMDLGDCSNGVTEFRFPNGSRSKLLHWRVTESSANDRFTFYGYSCEATTIERD